MARYIDADKIVFWIRYVSSNGMLCDTDVRKVAFSDEIARMPTADVAPRAEIINAIFDDIEASIAVHAYTSKSEDYAEGACDTIEWVDSKIAALRKKYTGANDE